MTAQDIAHLVPKFYARVRQDRVVGPIFGEAIALWGKTTDELLAPVLAMALQEKANRIARTHQLGGRSFRVRDAA